MTMERLTLINDELQADMYKKDIEPNLKEGLLFYELLHDL